MTTALEILTEIYRNIKDDYIDSDDKEEALTLMAELIIKLYNLK